MGEPQEENDLFFVCSFIEYKESYKLSLIFCSNSSKL